MTKPEEELRGLLRGWVLWREGPTEEPRWRYGTINTARAEITAFEEDLRHSPAGVAQPEDAFIVPGLVDMHAHLAIEDGPASSDQITANAWRQIRAGVLAVREPGSPVKVSPAELPFHRPVVVSAGRHIGTAKRYIRGIGVDVDGATEDRLAALEEEVRWQATHGDGWVKLVGDWIDRSNGAEADLDSLWTAEELELAVRVAHENGARVAVHAFGPAPIRDLLDAGVDSIEHGTGMSAGEIEEAGRRGIAVIPTLLQVEKFPDFAAAAGRYPRYAETMRSLHAGARQWFSTLVSSGALVLPGSDAGGYQDHGSIVKEMQTMVSWGMPPEDVFAAATWQARDFLGLPSLQVGAPVDIVVYPADPSTDSAVWSHPQLVIANGHVVPLAD